MNHASLWHEVSVEVSSHSALRNLFVGVEVEIEVIHQAGDVSTYFLSELANRFTVATQRVETGNKIRHLTVG